MILTYFALIRCARAFPISIVANLGGESANEKCGRTLAHNFASCDKRRTPICAWQKILEAVERDVPWDRNSARQEKGEENPLFQFLPTTQYYDLKKMFRNIVKIIHVTTVIAGSLAQ